MMRVWYASDAHRSTNKKWVAMEELGHLEIGDGLTYRGKKQTIAMATIGRVGFVPQTPQIARLAALAAVAAFAWGLLASLVLDWQVRSVPVDPGLNFQDIFGATPLVAALWLAALCAALVVPVGYLISGMVRWVRVTGLDEAGQPVTLNLMPWWNTSGRVAQLGLQITEARR